MLLARPVDVRRHRGTCSAGANDPGKEPNGRPFKALPVDSSTYARRDCGGPRGGPRLGDELVEKHEDRPAQVRRRPRRLRHAEHEVTADAEKARILGTVI